LGFVISVAGKGGVGKTTIAALIIRELCGEDKPVLAVDADPNYNLGEALGLPVTSTIGAIREELMKTKDELPAGVSKHQLVEYQIRLALQEEDCFDLLTMGRQEGPGCYCYINSVLRSFIDAMVSKYDYIVIDNEAGLEHLSRRTTVGSDLLLIVSDTNPVSTKAAGRIARLADDMELKIRRKVLVLNQCEAPPSDHHFKLAGYDFHAAYHIRSDRSIQNLSRDSAPISNLNENTPAIEDIRRVLLSELKSH